MKKSSKSPARRTKLEPLSIHEALSSPAVEGMFSFLDIRPEELLQARPLAALVPNAGSGTDPSPPAPLPSVSDLDLRTDQGGHINDPSPGIGFDAGPGPASPSPGLTGNTSDPTYSHDLNSRPGLDMHSVPGAAAINIPASVMNTRPGLELSHSPELGTIGGPGLVAGTSPSGSAPEREPSTVWPIPSEPAREPGSIVNQGPGLESSPTPGRELTGSPGLESNTSPGDFGLEREPSAVQPIGARHVQWPGPIINPSPGLELGHGHGPELTCSAGLEPATSPGGLGLEREPSAVQPIGAKDVQGPGSIINPSPGLESAHSPDRRLAGTPGLQANTNGARAASGPESPRSQPMAARTRAMDDLPERLLLPSENALERAVGMTPRLELNVGSGLGISQREGNDDIPALEFASQHEEHSLLISQVRYTVRRARLVQDGHTSNEQKLYEYLWTHGVPYDEVSRAVSIGFRTLAEKVRLARASAQKNLRALFQKLALEIIEGFDVASSKPPTYRVFNYSQILKRREAAGMTWYVRRTQAVRFVDSQGREIFPVQANRPGPELHSGPGPRLQHGAGPNVVPDPGHKFNPTPGPELGPQCREEVREKKSNQKTSSTSSLIPPDLISSLQSQSLLPSIDEEAVFLLWSECKSRVPDCTPAEVLHFANLKSAILRTGKIQNPVGFLITAVPKCFEGETFQHFRREQARLKEEQRRREEEERRKQQAIEEELDQYRRQEEAEGKAEHVLPTLSEEERKNLYDEARTQLRARGYKAEHWVMEQTIQRTVIRNLAKRILAEAQSTPT
jgi:hypothetical protein